MQLDKDVLLRKLLEAEMDSSAAAKQVSALRETVSHMSRSVSVSKMHLSEQFLYRNHFETYCTVSCTISDML